MKLHPHFLQKLLLISVIICILLSASGCGCQKRERSQIAEKKGNAIVSGVSTYMDGDVTLEFDEETGKAVSYGDQAIYGIGGVGIFYWDSCLYLFLTADTINQHPEVFCFMLPPSGAFDEHLALCYNPLITTGKIKTLEDRKQLEGDYTGSFDLYGTYTFTTNEQNQLVKVTYNDGGSYTTEWGYSYDEAGRLISYDGESLGYDADGKMVSVGLGDNYSFQYQDGRLVTVSKTLLDYDGTVSYEYAYDSASRVSSVTAKYDFVEELGPDEEPLTYQGSNTYLVEYNDDGSLKAVNVTSDDGGVFNCYGYSYVGDGPTDHTHQIPAGTCGYVCSVCNQTILRPNATTSVGCSRYQHDCKVVHETALKTETCQYCNSTYQCEEVTKHKISPCSICGAKADQSYYEDPDTTCPVCYHRLDGSVNPDGTSTENKLIKQGEKEGYIAFIYCGTPYWANTREPYFCTYPNGEVINIYSVYRYASPAEGTVELIYPIGADGIDGYVYEGKYKGCITYGHMGYYFVRNLDGNDVLTLYSVS